MLLSLILWTLLFNLSQSEEDVRRELMYSVKLNTGGYKILRLNGDLTTLLPYLQTGVSDFNISSLSGGNNTIAFNALSFHYGRELIAWSEQVKNDVEAVDGYFSGRTKILKYHEYTTDKVHGLAIDWVSDNMYWTDAVFNTITVAKLDHPRYTSTIVKTNLKTPWGIVVHPVKSYLFWSDLGRGIIERSSLSGQDRIQIAKADSPTSIALDIINDRIYWLDLKLHHIYSCNLIGADKAPLLDFDTMQPKGLTIYKEWILFIDQLQTEVHGYKTKNVSDGVKLTHVNVREMYDIMVYAPDVQPEAERPCVSSHCDHICVGANNNKNHECLCADTYVKYGTGKCRSSGHLKAPMYLYTINRKVCALRVAAPYMDTDDINNELKCFIVDAEDNTLGVDVHRGFIYVVEKVDNEFYSLVRYQADTNNLGHRQIITSVRSPITGVSVDWVSGNVYWTISDHGEIMVAPVSNKHVINVYKGLKKPSALVVDPDNRLLYWTEEGQSYIKKGYLSGVASPTILTTTDSPPIHLTLDLQLERLYWMEQDLIGWQSLTQKQSKQTHRLLNATPGGLTVYQGHIAWIDISKNRMVFLHKDDFELENYLTFKSDLRTIVTWDMYTQPSYVTHGCKNSGRCKQLCFPTSGVEVLCSCSIGYNSVGSLCETKPVNEHFSLVADSGLKSIIQVDNNGYAHAIYTSAISMAIPFAIAYNPRDQRVYWSDNGRYEINSIALDGSYPRTEIKLSHGTRVYGIALDIANMWLYFTDHTSQSINRIPLGSASGTPASLILKLSTWNSAELRDLAIDYEGKFLYWAVHGDEPLIERATLTGSSREAVINTDILYPTGLAISESKILCWCDGKEIECSDNRGNNRRVIIKNTNEVFHSIAVGDGSIFATTQTSRVIKIYQLESAGINPDLSSVSLSNPNGIVYHTETPIAGPPLPPINTTMIIGIAVGVGGFIALIVLIAVSISCCVKRRRRAAPPAQADLVPQHPGGQGIDNPQYSAQTAQPTDQESVYHDVANLTYQTLKKQEEEHYLPLSSPPSYSSGSVNSFPNLSGGPTSPGNVYQPPSYRTNPGSDTGHPAVGPQSPLYPPPSYRTDVTGHGHPPPLQPRNQRY